MFKAFLKALGRFKKIFYVFYGNKHEKCIQLTCNHLDKQVSFLQF